MSSLNINKSFIENSDYLKQLVSELKTVRVEDIDSNLLYEVAYADMYLNNLISMSDCNKLSKELSSIKTILDDILILAPYDKLSEVKKTIDYKSLLKCRYYDLELASYTRSYTVIPNPIVGYLLHKIPELLIAFFMFLFFFVFDLPSLLPSLFSSSLTMTENMQKVSNLLQIIGHLILTIYFASFFLGITLDLMYLTFPAIRGVLRERSVSNIVISCLDKNIQLKKVKDFNRINRNKHWLSSMLSVLEVQDKSDDLLKLYNEVLLTNKELAHIEETCSRNKQYYILIAKVEFLHDKYLQLI